MTIEWSESQLHVLSVCSFVSGCLSLVGSSFILTVFLTFFKSRRKQLMHRLVAYLSVCHFFLSLEWLVAGPLEEAMSDVMCQVVAPLRYFLDLASFFWTQAIATGANLTLT